MASEAIQHRLQAEFDSPPDLIRAIVDYLESGAGPLFIARYRRDECGDPGEERISAVAQRLAFLTELETRKASVLEQAAQRGDDVEALRARLADCYDQAFLDDLYHALRPAEHTASVKVAELGLQDLVESVHRHDLAGASPIDAAEKLIDEDKGLGTAEAVLEWVVLALGERYGENPEFRAKVRDELSRGILKAEAVAGPDGERKLGKRYKEFADFAQPVRKIPAPQMLSLRRAEREGVVHVSLHLPEGRELELFRREFSPDVDPTSPLAELLDLIYRHAYSRYVHHACETTVRTAIKEKADRETVRSFGRSLRAQLMAPPLGPKIAMAIRVQSNHVRFVVVGGDGAVVAHGSKPLQDDQRAATLDALRAVVMERRPAAIAIPHGRREANAQRLVDELLAGLAEEARPLVVPIDEAASVVFASSPAGRRRTPELDTASRATYSLARRLQDPLPELIRVDARGLGLGHNLTEVHQGLLGRQLDSIIESCVAAIGLDVNEAETDVLARVPGIDRELARAVVDHRTKHGRFASLAKLLEVDGYDDQRFLLTAGYLRVRGGDEPLDATAVPPENYAIAEKVAELKGTTTAELIGKAHRDVRLDDLVEAGFGRLRSLDTLHALHDGERDPRGEVRGFHNDGVTALEHVQLDQRLQGRVTNLTEFGAFVDLGVGHDGLVHVSQIPGSRLRDPNHTLRVGEVVTVFVVAVDRATQRISLSMGKPRHLAEGRPATIGERMGGGGRGRRRGPRDEAEVQNRAARSPDGRRGGRRGGRADGGGRGGRPPARDGRGPRGDRYERPAPGRSPRIITVESDVQHEESRGHKGELRSLAGLRALLGDREEPPKTDES